VIKIGHEACPGTQRSAGNVDQDMMRLQSVLSHEMELQVPKLVPKATDIVAMANAIDDNIATILVGVDCWQPRRMPQ
jgi:hypothetical protein